MISGESRLRAAEVLKEIVERDCMSLWDGCLCRLPKGHDGVHRCDGIGCGDEWDDVQAATWRRLMEFTMLVGSLVGSEGAPSTWFQTFVRLPAASSV